MGLNDYLRKEKNILIICALVFLISAFYAFYFKIRPAVDAVTYDQIAINIIEGEGYWLDTTVPQEQDGAIAYQGPLYPFFLAGIYGLFGHHYEAVWIVQAFLRALSALLLFLVCKKIFAGRARIAGWWAAGIFGFYPDLIEIGAMLMSETLFIFLMILFVYFFTTFYERSNFENTFSLALCFGLTMLTRSSVGLFLPIIVFAFCKKRVYKFLILFFVLFGLVMTPWVVRNYLVYEKFIPTMANFGFNPWVGNHEGADGEGGNFKQLYEAVDRLGPVVANEYALEQFRNFVKEYPLTYIKLTATRIIKYFSFIRPMGFWFYQAGASQFAFILSSVLASVLLFTFGFAGIFSFFKRREKNVQFVYLIIFAFLTCASIVPFLIETRYRLPVYPFMAIFAGFFISRLLDCKKEYLKYLIFSFSLLILNAGLNIVMEHSKIVEKINQILG